MIPTMGEMVVKPLEHYQPFTALDRLGPLASELAPRLSNAMRQATSVIHRVCLAWLHWRVTGSSVEAMPVVVAAMADDDGLRAIITAINTMPIMTKGAGEIWPPLDAVLQTAQPDLAVTYIAYIVDTVLGREQASRRLSARLGADRVHEVFRQLDAARDAD
jgi:hypothetical protein